MHFRIYIWNALDIKSIMASESWKLYLKLGISTIMIYYMTLKITIIILVFIKQILYGKLDKWMFYWNKLKIFWADISILILMEIRLHSYTVSKITWWVRLNTNIMFLWQFINTSNQKWVLKLQFVSLFKLGSFLWINIWPPMLLFVVV